MFVSVVGVDFFFWGGGGVVTLTLLEAEVSLHLGGEAAHSLEELLSVTQRGQHHIRHEVRREVPNPTPELPLKNKINHV